jgi:uncharacterized protein
MSLAVEWDPARAESNLQKHGVSFGEAATVLGDPLSITTVDPDHSAEEDRFLLPGQSASGRFLVVSATDRSEAVRIISARAMTPRERRIYELAVGR